MGSVYSQETRGSLDEVGTRLEQAVKDRGYGVLGTIDLKAKMNEKGVAFEPGCRVFEVCNPQRAKGVLERQMAISTVLPCRISLYEDGGRPVLAMLRPTVLLAPFDRPDLDEEARQVEQDMEAIIEQAARA